MANTTIKTNTTFPNATSILITEKQDYGTTVTLYDKVIKVIFKGSKVYIHRDYYGSDITTKFNRNDVEKISVYKAS